MDLDLVIVWGNVTALPSKSYTCGHCGKSLASQRGYSASYAPNWTTWIYICHVCHRPTYFDPAGEQIPGVAFGDEVGDIDDAKVSELYAEARRAIGANCFTASVLCCRKLLMHIAVDLKAKENETFAFYVDYLAEKNFIPPGAKSWVDHIRKTANEANHEITLMERKDAEELVTFLEMLLKIIYEFPATAKRKYPEKTEPNSTES